MKTNLTIMGIDPGYDRLGWAIGQFSHQNEWSSIDFGCIQTNASLPIFARYTELKTDLEALLAEFKPTVVGIETIYFSNNQKTALRVSEARGLIIGQLLSHQPLTIYELTPNQIKQTVTGYGSADKAAVAKMVQSTLQLAQTDVIDDAIDALAAMITCQVSLRSAALQG
jgi:crossover junction endodeoxyribonuclease RuvC